MGIAGKVQSKKQEVENEQRNMHNAPPSPTRSDFAAQLLEIQQDELQLDDSTNLMKYLGLD